MSSINGSHGTVTKADLHRGCYCQYNVRAPPSATGSHKLTCIPTTKCMYRWPSLLGASKLGCTKTHLGTCDATAAVLAGGGEDDINHELQCGKRSGKSPACDMAAPRGLDSELASGAPESE